MKIYADNAATTRIYPAAAEAMMQSMNKLYGNPSSLYSLGQDAKEALENARAEIAECLNCDKNEVFFTSGGSESDCQALETAARYGNRRSKKHIVSTKFEHHAVLHYLDKLQGEGFEITLVDVNENGVVDVKQIEQAIRADTCLVSVMYVNNEIGTIQSINEIGAICRRKGVLFHTDAVQAVGHIPVDFQADNIDMLSLSAHKFHGPKGVGAFLCRKGVLPANIIFGGAQERGKRAGTENLPAIIGMAAALRQSLSLMSENADKITYIRDKIITGLSGIPHSALNGDAKKRVPNNVNFCFDGIEGESLLLLLDDLGISASSGSACTSGSLDPSHVLLAIGRPPAVAHGSLRLTVSEDITEEEADYIIESVAKVVKKLREMSPVWRDYIDGKSKFIL